MEFIKNLIANIIFWPVFLVCLYFLLRHVYLIITESWRVEQSTLTLEQYLKKYPQCGTDRGIRCAACNASSIKNWGFKGANDSRRLFICNHCNTRLYRSDDW